MKLKIKKSSMKKNADKVHKAFDENYPIEVHQVKSIVRSLASDFYWLPVFDMLCKAKLIDNKLNPGEYMYQSRFAITKSDLAWSEKEEENTAGGYILTQGKQFMENLLKDLSGKNMLPDPSIKLTMNLNQ